MKKPPAEYLKIAREMESKESAELTPVRVAFLSTFTIEVLKPYLRVEGASHSLGIQAYFAPFNQLEQQVLDFSSPLYAAKPDVIVLALRLEDVAPQLVFRFVKLSVAEREKELETIEGRIRNLCQTLRATVSASIVIFNFAPPAFLAAGLADPLLETAQSSFMRHANDRLAKICLAVSAAYIFDYARVVSEVGLKKWYDPRLLFMGRIPFGAEAQIATASSLARFLKALWKPPCKCLVVDLDNTLWGGVIGEEGLDGIQLGEDYPGNVYKDFQRALLSLSDRGILLAIASKNNEAEAREVFEKHPACLLQWNDFAAVQIHWKDKAASLKAIAKELGIGTDALAFFDDSPVEREWIRSQMPEVTVIDVPTTPLGYLEALTDSSAFDQLLISAEDQKRTEMIHGEKKRQELQSSTLSLDDFLQTLQMKAIIGPVGHETAPRVVQLLAKTNQFNLTTRRHTASDLEGMLRQGVVALWLRASDRFGDNGLVGVAIARPQNRDEWMLDTFLLSCRVIGRCLDMVLLDALISVIHKKGGKTLWGEYIETPKNQLVADFFPTHNFELVDQKKNLWKWDLSRGGLVLPWQIERSFLNAAGN